MVDLEKRQLFFRKNVKLSFANSLHFFLNLWRKCKNLYITTFIFIYNTLYYIYYIILRYIYFVIKERRLKLFERKCKSNLIKNLYTRKKGVYRVFLAYSLKIVHCDVKYGSLRFLFYETIFRIRQVKSKISQPYLMPIARQEHHSLSL